MISCIILSAGFSKRFGSPKALAKLNGGTIIEHLQQLLVATQVHEIKIVLGAQADQIKPYILNHKKVKFVYNKDYKFGQTSSFKAGLKHIPKDCKGILLLPVDYPLIKKETIDYLINIFIEKEPTVLIPTFNNIKGHPPIFHARIKKDLEAIDNSQGLNTMAHRYDNNTINLPVEDMGVIITFKTVEEFERIKSGKSPT